MCANTSRIYLFIDFFPELNICLLLNCTTRYFYESLLCTYEQGTRHSIFCVLNFHYLLVMNPRDATLSWVFAHDAAIACSPVGRL